MLGFTRHERLDVKKPGPPPARPPIEIDPKVQAIERELANHEQKTKKVSHLDDEHAPHSVDTDYAHVYLKTS